MAAATVGRTVGIPLLPPAPAGGGGDDGGDDGDDDGGDDGGDAAATVAAMPAAGAGGSGWRRAGGRRCDDGGGCEGRRPHGGAAGREGWVGGRERAQAQAVRAGAGVQTCVRACGT